MAATALAVTIGYARQFRSGCQMAGFLGPVPKQNSSNDRAWLGQISKRSDTYLSRLLVHGARAA